MFNHLFLPCALALLASGASNAATDDELKALREETRQIKADNDVRIQALEKRLKDAEAAQAPASRAATPTGNAFNPDMSLILSGAYRNLSQDPANYRISGFIPGGEGTGPGARGFNLSESELTISANIDPNFSGYFTAAITPENSVGVEEAFIRTTALGNGVSVKAGRFFSGIGYLNEQHAHAWDFSDNPLAYQAFLGKQFAHDGVQVKWLAPTDLFVELGAEAGNGSRFPGTARNTNGVNASSLFAHAGGDVGDSHAWRAGVAFLHTRAQDRVFDDKLGDVTVPFSFSGTSKLLLADVVWKWSPNGNVKETNFKLQGEYIRRKEDGAVIYSNPLAPGFVALNEPYASNQSGFYVQGIYQFTPHWRTGLRYDKLFAGDVNLAALNNGALGTEGISFLSNYNPSRTTLMFDFNPSEFSRFRLQYAQDKSRGDVTDNQLYLQYIMSLGAHGAHKF